MKSRACIRRWLSRSGIDVFCFGLLTHTISFSATLISGSQSGTLPRAQSPYLITADVYIPGGQRLTIEPGVVIQFQDPDDALIIDGTLVARGTADAPILFTSDDQQKAPGQWEAIIFRDGSVDADTILEYCVVEYGGAERISDELIRLESASPTLRNCTIRQSRLHGMNLLFSDPTIENCQFINNGATSGGFAILMRADSLPRLRNNTATGNGHDAIGVFGYNFSRTGTWVKDNLPYTLVEDLFVNGGQTLTIEPGVAVQFQDADDALVVDGTLIAKGTAAAPIRFTSDDAQKVPGQWEAIVFRGPNTNSILENCVIEFAAAAGLSDESIRFENASPTIRNCLIASSRFHGMTFLLSDATVGNCQFLNNGSTNRGAFAMAMRSDSLPRLNNNTATGNVHDSIGVFGFNFNRSGVWRKDNPPYTLVEDLYVNGGQTLTIEPGVVIQFQDPDDGLIVDGTLIARGTTAAPIRFTSDDAPKTPGQWEGLIFRDTSDDTKTILENCLIEYGAAQGVSDEMIRFESASPTIRNCGISNSRLHGVTFLYSDPVVENCQFINNGTKTQGFAMLMRTDALPRLRNNSATGNGHDAVAVYGFNFSRSGTWTKDNVPYTVVEDLIINGGARLTIEPGVLVQFQDPDDALVVDGTLIARGTATAPIRFTSDEADKKPGQWEAIVFRDTAVDADTILENCVAEFGGANADGNVVFYSASPRIANCTVANSLGDGFHANNSSPPITRCRVLRNGRDGIRTSNRANPVINDCTIAGNSGFGVQNLDTTLVVNARNNFWGDPSGPLDTLNTDGRGQTNANGKGDKVSEYVDWSGFLQTDPNVVTQVPKISAAPNALDFGNVTIGQTKDLTFAVLNSGNAELTVNSIAIDNARFTVISPATPFNVSTGAQQVVLLRFAPTAAGNVSGSLSVGSNDPAQAALTVALTGIGVASGVSTRCVQPAAGLVAWWPGEGNANDIVGSSSGTSSSTLAFPTGQVGRAMNFDGVGDQVKVAASAALNVGAGDGLTIEAWINPADENGKPIVEWNDGGSFGAHLWIYGGPGVLFANLVDTNRTYHLFQSPAGTVVANAFQHVALTYDKRTGQASLFRNGLVVAQQNVGSFTPQTSTDLYFGRRASSNDRFKGLIDEISIYGRALAPAEIQEIFNAGSAGKCAPSSGGGDYVLSRIELTRTFGSPGLVPASTRPLLESLSADSRSFELGWSFKWPDPTGPNWNTAVATTALTQVPAALTPGAPATLAATMTGRWDTQGYGVERDHTLSLSGVAGINQYSNVGSPSGVQSGQFNTTNTLTVPAPVAGEIALVLKAGLRFGDDHTGAMDIKLVYTRTSSQLASIRGKVTDAQTQAALAAVTIAVNGSTVAQSDANGNYAVTNVAAGLVAMSASKAGYLSQTKTVDLSTSQTAMVDFALVLAPAASVFFSDGFNRADADRCALGRADLAFGGTGSRFYLPIFPFGGTDASRPVGANIVATALQNNGLDYGGVQFAASDGACANLGVRGQNLGQDLNIRVDVLVPTDASGNVAQAGPYLRSRAAPAGDGIIGGADFDPSGGYWVQLHSHGEIKVKRLSPVATIAFSGRPLSFNPNVIHTLEIAAQGDALQVALDGKLQTFNQDGKLAATVAIPTTGIGNQGAAGIAFGAEDNRGRIGGQRADNLIVSPFRSLTGLPVQNNFEQARPLVLSVRLDGQNNVLVSWPPDAGKVRIEMTASLSSPIQWTVLTNLPVLANGQPTITVPSTLRALPTLCFRGVSESAAQTPGGGTGKAASPLAGATESVSAALDGLNQIPITGTAQDFEARVNLQLALLQNAVEAFDAALGSLASQSDADIAALSKFLLLGRTSEDAATRQLSLAGAIGKANSGFVPGPLTDVINQFKQLKQTVDDLKKLKKQIKDGSDLVNLITQNKSLEEIAASRSSFFKQISEVFKKMRADVESPLNEMLLGKNQAKQDDVEDYTALVAFVRATDARLADLMSAPGFTIESYRILNLTDRQKDLIAQGFRSSTLRGRLYLRDNLLGFLKTLASAGVETYVSTIIEATGGKGVKSSAELAKKVYDFLTQNTAATPTILRFISRKRFLRPDDLGSEVKADLFLLAKLPDGNTRLATFLVEGKNVINERGDLLLTLGLQLPVLAYDVLVVPREQENAPVKLLPFATTVNANVTSFVDLPLVHATKVTLNLGAKQRNSSGNLTDAVLTYGQAQSLTVRVDGFPQAADGPMGGVFDSETRPDGTQRGFFVIPFLPPDKPLKLNITGTPIEDFAEAFTVTSAQSERPVTLVLKAPPPVSVPVYVPTISWRLRNNADDTVVATGSGTNFTKTVTATVFNSRGPNVVSITISGTLVAPAVSLGQPFDLTCTLTRSVESAIAGLSSSSELSLDDIPITQTVNSRVVPTNPVTISETLNFRPIANGGELYKIDLTGAPGFSGGGPLNTFIAADTFGGVWGNFSMSGDNSGIATGNGKVTITGNVYVGSELSTSNPHYRLDVTVIYQ